jgi:hypothetical protein
MTDYWLSKMFFDLQGPKAVGEYRADRASVIQRYPLSPEVRAAVMADDVAVLAPRVNPYLLRYYFTCVGMSDADFMAKLRALRPGEAKPESAHG